MRGGWKENQQLIIHLFNYAINVLFSSSSSFFGECKLDANGLNFDGAFLMNAL